MELFQEKKIVPCLLICRSGRRRDVHDNKKVFLFMPFLRGHLSPQKGGAWLHMNNSQGACRVGRRPPKKSALFEIEKKKVSSYMCTLAWHVFFPGRLSSATTRKVPSPNPFLLAAKARLQGRKRGGGGGKWSSAHRKTLSFSSPPPHPWGGLRGGIIGAYIYLWWCWQYRFCKTHIFFTYAVLFWVAKVQKFYAR